jgi:hypothetical protein
MIRAFLVLALALAAPVPLAAQTPAEAAAQNMQLAAELCLRNHRTEADLPQAFAAAGFSVTPLSGAGTFDFVAPGIDGTVDTVPASAFCSIQSTLVPLEMAEAIGRATAERLFADKVEEGAPERNINEPLKPCEGLQIFATQDLITISYAAAGNSGECLNDGTSAILIRM